MAQGHNVNQPVSVMRFRAGQPIREGHLNQIVDAVNETPIGSPPIRSSLVRLAQTVQDGAGPYPNAATFPTKYAFRFIYLSPTGDAVDQDDGTVELSADSRDTFSGYVVNIEGCGTNPYSYIPEGTIIGVVPGPGHYWCSYRDTGTSFFVFELNEVFAAGSAASNIYQMDLTPTGTVAEVQDPLNIFGEMEVGSFGICFRQGGYYWAVQGQCALAEIGEGGT